MENIKNIFFRQRIFFVALSLTVIVIFGTTMDMKPLQAKMTSIALVASSPSSSRPMNAREIARERRAKLLASKKKAVIETKPVYEATPRPSTRFIRTKTAAPDAPESTSVRPTVIPEKAGCGDNLVIYPETCDDANKIGGDGCSATCTRETGFDCNPYTHPTVCRERCGNGAVSPHETCDDGNTTDDDGCSNYCKVEVGFSCTKESPNVCTAVCGNGFRSGPETCDDGNTTNGDGCSSSCMSE